MPSLRRSLIGYILILLSIALGSLALLIDQFANMAIESRQKSEQQRIEQEYTLRCQDSQNTFDATLLQQAQSLAREVRSLYVFSVQQDQEYLKRFRSSMALMAIGHAGSEWSYPIMFSAVNNYTFRIPIYFANYGPKSVQQFDEFIVDELVRRLFEGGEHPDYFQLHLPYPQRPIQSQSQPFIMPLVTDELNETGDRRIDDLDLDEHGQFRRITFRTFSAGPPSGSRFDNRGASSRRDRGGSSSRKDPGQPPPMYVQYAKKSSELTTLLKEHDDNRTSQLAILDVDVRSSLNNLRFRVGGIFLGTFISLAVGGWLLVGLGLAPIRRLSDAVSQVNERDFRLPVAKEQLTVELAPIHDRLSATLSALARAFDREKEAVADISHELRTPVAGLLATLDVALRRPRTTEQYKTTLEECRVISKQLAQLVERVMTLAYLDAGHVLVEAEEFDLIAVATTAVAVIRPLAESQQVQIQLEFAEKCPIESDRSKVREVLMNFLHNAIEYNKPNGSMIVRIRPSDDGGAVLEVQDTGIGMSQDTQSKIFERFYRADSSRTSTGVHAGLGLAIVKEYVRQLGGNISVSSAVDVGSTFRVTLPANFPKPVQNSS